MSDLDRVVIYLLFGVVLACSDLNRRQIIATIKDNGCASHIDMPAPKNLTNADTYKEW